MSNYRNRISSKDLANVNKNGLFSRAGGIVYSYEGKHSKNKVKRKKRK